MRTDESFPQGDPDYQYFGHLNSISADNDAALHILQEDCKGLGHGRESYNTNRGDHGIWCEICKYSYKYCSGD